MPSRTPGDQPDPAAELLRRWQAHHSGTPETSRDDEDAEEPLVTPTPTAASETSAADLSTPTEPTETTEPTEPTETSRPPKHAATRTPSGQRRPPSPRGADQTEAGREVIEALGITTTPAVPSTPVQAPAPARPRARPPREPAPPPGRTTDVEFAPRMLLRRTLGVILLVLLPLTAAACYVAYDQPETLSLGIAGTLLVLLLVVYAVRIGSTPSRLAIHSGQLVVVRGNTREVFDLTSRFTRLEVVGRPGRHGWKVLMARFGRDPLVIDSSMVDPVKFTAALEFHRPQSR